MRTLIKSLILLFCITLITAATATDYGEIVIEHERVSPKVLRVYSGKTYMDQIMAIATEKGIVVIDAGKAPTLTAKYRKVVEQEFGRDDFIYLINTHFHFDHTDGNQVFKDATIISHITSPDRIREFDKGRPDFIAARKNRMKNWEEQWKAAETGSEDKQRFQDILASNLVMLDDLENNYQLTLPTITFSDHLTLDLGDITLKLIYFGEGRHTGDDIIIYCPEEKMLFTGDLFYKESYLAAWVVPFDGPRWIIALDSVIEEDNPLKWVFDTHNGRMTGEYFTGWANYFKDMYQSVESAKNQGLDFPTVEKQLAYKGRFDYIESTSGLTPQQLEQDHRQGLTLVWQQIMGLQTASQELQNALAEGGINGLKERIESIKGEQDKFVFSENDLNGLGYMMLRYNQQEAAILIFKFNVELYPDSWNVYDSLAEAYLKMEQNDKALQNYRKVLSMNPDDTRVADIIKELEK